MKKRKDKVFYHLWVTKAEDLSLIESLDLLRKESTSKENGWAMSNITEIIQQAQERGDLKKRRIN